MTVINVTNARQNLYQLISDVDPLRWGETAFNELSLFYHESRYNLLEEIQAH